jgi:hypothetical protein
VTAHQARSLTEHAVRAGRGWRGPLRLHSHARLGRHRDRAARRALAACRAQRRLLRASIRTPGACVMRQTHCMSGLLPLVLASLRRPMRSKETSAVCGRSRHNHGTNAAETGHGAMPIGQAKSTQERRCCRITGESSACVVETAPARQLESVSRASRRLQRHLPRGGREREWERDELANQLPNWSGRGLQNRRSQVQALSPLLLNQAIVLMIVGAVGLVLSLAFWSSWGGFGNRSGATRPACVTSR